MSTGRGIAWALGLAASAALAAVPASGFVKPQSGQAAYEIPLKEFDLFNYRSPETDSERAQAEAGLTQSYGGIWSVYSWNPQSRTPSEMYGSGVNVGGPLASADDVKALAERIIQANPSTFRADLSGLQFTEATNAPASTNAPDGVNRPPKWAAHFKQVYHGVDVVGGEVHMTFLESGRLFALGSTYYPDISVNWIPSLTADHAKEIARGALPFNTATDSIEPEAPLLILPVPLSETQVDYHLVWQVRVHTKDPLGVWATSVDAQSGEIIKRTNEVDFVDYYGTAVGNTERFSYCDGQRQEALPYIYVNISGVGTVYADDNGNWDVPYGGTGYGFLFSRLYSPYVDVQNSQGANAGIQGWILAGTPYQINFNDTNSRADERDVYRTIQDVHDFFETFAPGYSFTNQRVTAYVNINNTCNAYYLNDTINFYQAGGGCANTGQMMDVVAHEYGHGVQESILGGQGNQGLGEGNGDVTGFMMTMSSVIGRGFYNCNGGIRDAHNSLKYPGDVINQEIHYAGQVIAGFHWDAMQDQIADYGSWGKYSAAWDWFWGRVLQHPMDQPAQVLATFIANDDDGDLTNGTPQYNSYCLAATNHGFTCPTARLPLASAACDTYYQIPQSFRMVQSSIYWTAVAVNPSPGDDKDMRVYSDDGLTLLASSTGTVGTDFVVGDFNHNPTGAYQPYVSYGGSTTPYVVEWDDGPDQITLGSDIYGNVGGGGGGCGLVQAWDVYLEAGKSYRFLLSNMGGSADVRVSLFRNPAAAPYWAGRYSSVFELPYGTPAEYAAPASDWYGVVVFNNSPGAPAGSYMLRVQQSPVPLASGQCQSWTTSPRMFSFNQPSIYWTGVAVNPSGSDDKDIVVYGDPDGLSSPLAASAGTVGTDFVVGDFNHNTLGTYYARVQYGGINAQYVTEWDDGPDAITIGNDVNGSVGGGSGGCGLIQVWDVYLTQGQQYRFLLMTNGAADIRMSLFRNPSSSTYWAGRSASEFEAGNADGRTYTAPATDWYGVVVFNNSPDSPAGNYTLRVRNAPTALADGACQSGQTVPQMYSFTESYIYWSCVGVNPTGADDKDVWVYDNPDGLGNPLAYSTGTQGTDFVIGDFNSTPLGTYYAMATYGASPANYVVDWDNGPDIFPMGSAVQGSVGGGAGGCGLVKVWDVYLTAGTTYRLWLTSGGSADIRVSLFRNPTNGAYWASRYNAEFEQQPSGTPYTYTAPATDFYGLVVFNASPGSPPGDYTVRFDSPSAVEETAVSKPEITFPNPYPAGSPIMLRAAADGTRAQVYIYNVQGQLVRTLLDESVGKAARQVQWDGRAEGGARMSAGIYFVHAQIGALNVRRSMILLK